MNIYTLEELAKELRVGKQTIIYLVDDSKKIFAQYYISDSIKAREIDNLLALEEFPRLPLILICRLIKCMKSKELKRSKCEITIKLHKILYKSDEKIYK